jgi:hypothetical protein
MDALIYGIMPRAKIERFSTAPPENILKRPRSVPVAFVDIIFSMTERLTPGVVTKIPRRYTASIKRVKITLSLKSGILKMFFNTLLIKTNLLCFSARFFNRFLCTGCKFMNPDSYRFRQVKFADDLDNFIFPVIKPCFFQFIQINNRP